MNRFFPERTAEHSVACRASIFERRGFGLRPAARLRWFSPKELQ